MKLKKQDFLQILLLIFLSMLFYWALNHLSEAGRMLGRVFSVLTPLLAGGAIAFVCSVPLRLIENLWDKVFGKKAPAAGGLRARGRRHAGRPGLSRRPRSALPGRGNPPFGRRSAKRPGSRCGSGRPSRVQAGGVPGFDAGIGAGTALGSVFHRDPGAAADHHRICRAAAGIRQAD